MGGPRPHDPILENIGKLIAEHDHQRGEEHDRNGLPTVTADYSIKKEKVKIKKAEPLKEELQSFIECVRTGKKPIVSGVEGRRALAVALDILEKIKSSKQ